jgi:histone deacetylase 1/2
MPVLQKDTPVHCLFHVQPNYDFLRTFGCACWPSLRKYNAHKLAFRPKLCVFLGYSPMHKGYKCLDKSTRCIYISRDVVFDESIFPYATPRVAVDIPTVRQAITFPSTEQATHDHVRRYDLSYLATNPPLLGDVPLVQVPLVADSLATPPAAATSSGGSPATAAYPAAPSAAASPPAMAADLSAFYATAA